MAQSALPALEGGRGGGRSRSVPWETSHAGLPALRQRVSSRVPERIFLFRWENKDVYATAIRNLRLHELQTPECVMAVRAGLASIIPLQVLTLLTPLEMELRTCGLPYINLEFLKVI